MQHRTFPLPARALCALLLSAVCGMAPASAAVDLLTLPALQSPRAAGSLLLAIASAGTRLVAAGERGIIVYSDDRGATWRQARVPVSLTLTTLFFATANVGWAAGHDGVILRTDDGGASWHKQFDGNNANALILADLKARRAAANGASPGAIEALDNALADAESGTSFGPALPLFGLWFENVSHGLAVGAFGQLFQTNDGGRTWSSLGGRIANVEGLHYNSIAMAGDGSLMIAGERGKLRRSRDRGTTWETLDTGYAGHLYGVLAPAGGARLVAFGFGGTVLISDDDGKRWRQAAKLVNKSIVGALVLPDGALALAAGDGQLLISHDHGASYNLIKDGAGRPVAALLRHPLAPGQLLAVGNGGARVIAIGASGP